jgi:NAD(P)-dependent dehydrogenase (short-subunit alcohol dehydrogenase family)
MSITSLAGRTAVVTGAGSGIGRALCLRFAADGANVVLADVQPDALEESLALVRAAGAAGALAQVTDVAAWDSVEDLARAAVQRFGKVHVVCNNAGVGGGGLIADQHLVDWRWVLNVNLWGVIHGVQAFLPLLQAHGEGAHIVNTASVAGLVGGPGLGPYNASKFAVVGISETLYHELQAAGSKVGVTVLCPGNVRTNIASAQRNRPDELRRPRPAPADGATAPRVDARRRNAQVAAAVAAGMDPGEVADKVLDAIRTGRFWLVTHPELLAWIDQRNAELGRQENPTLPSAPTDRD